MIKEILVFDSTSFLQWYFALLPITFEDIKVSASSLYNNISFVCHIASYAFVFLKGVIDNTRLGA